MRLLKWKIREIEIPNQFVLAPMAGITNEAFRIICKEMNCGLVVAEMVSDKAIGFQNQRTLKLKKEIKIIKISLSLKEDMKQS